MILLFATPACGGVPGLAEFLLKIQDSRFMPKKKSGSVGRQIFLFFSNLYLLKTSKIDNMQHNSYQILENDRHGRLKHKES